MDLIRRFSENKTQTHRWLFITQILSPMVMFFGATYQSPVLVWIGLVGLVLANSIAVLIK